MLCCCPIQSNIKILVARKYHPIYCIQWNSFLTEEVYIYFENREKLESRVQKDQNIESIIKRNDESTSPKKHSRYSSLMNSYFYDDTLSD